MKKGIWNCAWYKIQWHWLSCQILINSNVFSLPLF